VGILTFTLISTNLLLQSAATKSFNHKRHEGTQGKSLDSDYSFVSFVVQAFGSHYLGQPKAAVPT
jgi:hypothetical protein